MQRGNVTIKHDRQLLCMSSSANQVVCSQHAAQVGTRSAMWQPGVAWKKSTTSCFVSVRSAAASRSWRSNSSVPRSISAHCRLASCRSAFGFSSFDLTNSSNCQGSGSFEFRFDCQ